MRPRGAAAACLAALSALAQAVPGAAEPPAQTRADGAVLMMQMVSVTGTLRLASLPAGQGTALEIDSGALGRYRIDEGGLGAELHEHVGKDVTVVAYVSRASSQAGPPLLQVERFTLHDG